METHEFSNGTTDPLTWSYLPMTGDQTHDILARLERLDAGQRYVIERMGELRAHVGAIEEKLDQTREDLRHRVQRLEDREAARDKANAPWQHLIFSVLAAVAASGATFYLLHIR